MPRIRQYADRYAMQDLASHISGRMDAQGMTQYDLGAKLGVSQQTISRLLKHPDKISIGMLRKICKAVEIDRDAVSKAAWCSKT